MMYNIVNTAKYLVLTLMLALVAGCDSAIEDSDEAFNRAKFERPYVTFSIFDETWILYKGYPSLGVYGVNGYIVSIDSSFNTFRLEAILRNNSREELQFDMELSNMSDTGIYFFLDPSNVLQVTYRYNNGLQKEALELIRSSESWVRISERTSTLMRGEFHVSLKDTSSMRVDSLIGKFDLDL